MQKIVPSIWFDSNAEEAANFYISIFKNTRILNRSYYTNAGFEIHKKPAGSLLTIEFEIEGYKFLALNGGPAIKPNPSISFFYNTSSQEDIRSLWDKLLEGGNILMDLQEYSFSKLYGWVEDKFGTSWQLNMVSSDEKIDTIIPSLLFTKNQAGNAENAVMYYRSIFKDSSIGQIYRYGKDDLPNKEEDVMYMDFILEKLPFTAMDSRLDHKFAFNEGISFIVYCNSQEEIDYYWNRLTEGGDPSAQVCGWLKDKYGVSWQIVPLELDQMMLDKDVSKVDKVMASLLQMSKIDYNKLKEAYSS